MTSLDFFPPDEASPRVYPEWGSGMAKGERKENIWTPGPPTWQYSGRPTEQDYTLTDLRLSNVRLNDQLLPNPQNSNMHELMINLPFPAEHPYASHQERKAVFPKFDSAADPKRGVAARKAGCPKNDEMPSMPYDVTIVSKTKGSGLRHEIQKLPPESLKKPLEWHEHSFDQLVKSPNGGRQPYYPTNPKTLVPNLEAHGSCLSGDMSVGERTATAMRNVERDQWSTTYDRQYTGLGPVNPLKLDNYEDKKDALYLTGQEDDTLRPSTTNTFDPARPREGRINRQFIPQPRPQTGEFPEHQKNPNYTPRPTEHEREEDRLWNGGKHPNLPDGQKEGEWLSHEATIHPEVGLSTLAEGKAGSGPQEPAQFAIQSQPAAREDKGKAEWGEIEERAHKFHTDVQQMEASNRWKELELQQPNNNLQALQQKMSMASIKAKPEVFYDHEGKFMRERSGLYKTTYDPYAFQALLNKDEKTGGRLFDTSDSHKDALNLDVDLNGDMHEAMRWNRTLGGPPGSVPQLHAQPSPYEAIEPFNRAKSLQKAALQPQSSTADVRTQEKELVLTESTMGGDYNTQKFLQENEMPFYARNEPNVLMSSENQDLSRVRLSCTPRALSASRPLPAISSGEPAMSGSQTDRPSTTPSAGQFANRYSYQQQEPYTSRDSHPASRTGLPTRLNSSRPRFPDQFLSSSSNIAPGTATSASQKSAYEAQFGGALSLDLSYKDDPRFDWKVGCGTPRPQTSLLKLQSDFVKSDVRKKFLSQFPEKNPDLRENIIRGKKHNFAGFNAQVLRGTPVVA